MVLAFRPGIGYNPRAEYEGAVTPEEIEMNEYHRTITEFLRGHGARDVHLEAGGRHPHVNFIFRDKQFDLAVHRDGDGHTDAAIIKVKELEKMLGEPDVKPEPELRRLDDMTPAIRSNGATTLVGVEPYLGSIALYNATNGSKRIRFFLPEEVVRVFGPNAVALERTRHDAWRLTKSDSKYILIRADGKQRIIDGGNKAKLVSGFPEPFGTSPAEYRIAGSVVDVRLLLDKLKPVKPAAPRATRKAKPDPKGQCEGNDAPEAGSESTVAAPEDEPSTRIKWVEPSMNPREILAAIAEVECTSPYRLKRLADGGWAWQAPIIKLTPTE